MKLILAFLTFTLFSFAMAAEVETNCQAMNESRENIVKSTSGTVVKTIKGSSSQ